MEDDFTIDLLTECGSPEDRRDVEKQIFRFLARMKIKDRAITNSSQGNTVDISWVCQEKFEDQLTNELIDMASNYNLCFELLDSSDEERNGPVFIGVDAIRHEVEYYLGELRENARRLVRRTDKLASLLKKSPEEVQRYLEFFLVPLEN